MGGDIPRGYRSAPGHRRAHRRPAVARVPGDGRGSGGETRTLNLAVNSRSLCRLSYPGKVRTAARRCRGVPEDISRCRPPLTGKGAPIATPGHNGPVKLRIGTAIAFGIGYTLGARAGRERYQQIVRLAGQVGRSTPVAGTATLIGRQVQGRGLAGGERMKDTIGVRLGWRDGDQAADAIALDLAEDLATALNSRRLLTLAPPGAACGRAQASSR